MNSASEVKIYRDVKEYIQATRSFLEAREEIYGLFLGNFSFLENQPTPTAHFMAEVRSNGQTAFAAFYRNVNMILSEGSPELITAVLNKLDKENIEIPGVIGPLEVSEFAARVWSDLRGCEYTLAMDQLIYTLKQVTWPQNIPGSLRVATESDIELIAQWMLGFHQDALPNNPFDINESREITQRAIPHDNIFIWDLNGTPVATAALARPTRHGITVNAVYTPPEFRKNGYATALVAAVSELGLKRGKNFCTLYTDLSNPSSNSIYQKIGYRPIAKSRVYRFGYTPRAID